MSEEDIEKRLQGLQIRGPDATFMAGLRARLQTELAAGQPLPWWSRNRLAVLNAGLALAVVLVLVLQPGLPRGLPPAAEAPEVAAVDTVREAYRPGALVVLHRLQRPLEPQTWSDTLLDPKLDSRREPDDHQTLGLLATR